MTKWDGTEGFDLVVRLVAAVIGVALGITLAMIGISSEAERRCLEAVAGTGVCMRVDDSSYYLGLQGGRPAWLCSNDGCDRMGGGR